MKTHTYDIIICGLGVGACLLLRELRRKQLIDKFSICILEPEIIKQSGKALCFWDKPNSQFVVENEDIISISWSHAEVPPLKKQIIEPYRYYKVQSQLLYQSITSLLKEYEIEVLSDRVLSIEEGVEGAMVFAGCAGPGSTGRASTTGEALESC